jgi:hypothetical protein
VMLEAALVRQEHVEKQVEGGQSRTKDQDRRQQGRSPFARPWAFFRVRRHRRGNVGRWGYIASPPLIRVLPRPTERPGRCVLLPGGSGCVLPGGRLGHMTAGCACADQPGGETDHEKDQEDPKRVHEDVFVGGRCRGNPPAPKRNAQPHEGGTKLDQVDLSTNPRQKVARHWAITVVRTVQ